jgi:outer membrane protein OmpA-like peptidoglycan-associated protein
LALGDRRAVTVRDYLASLGIGADRVVTRSLGKESPFCVAIPKPASPRIVAAIS